jgi:hypothetical protein
MSRLFTFGCSFTQYWRWPTWADALGKEFDFFENWGICGSGNGLIFNSLIECNQRRKITADDSVFIMWTNTSREDRYVGDKWIEGGNVYWTEGSMYPPGYVEKFACERGYLIRDLAYITAAKQLLESWNCHWNFFAMVPLSQTNQANHLGDNPHDVVGEDTDVRLLYSNALCAIKPSVFETVFNSNWNTGTGLPDANNPNQRDFHPSPGEHLQYLDQVCPGLIQKESTREWMLNWENNIRQHRQEWSESRLPACRL